MIRRLEVAIAIDTHRSFHRAARAVGLSQPALTRSLQSLEKEFGVRLFERGKIEARPTAFGRIVLAHARRIVSQVAEARREIDLLRGLERGELRIGIGTAGPQQWVGSAIGDLCATNPKLRVCNVELPGHRHADALMAGEIDVAVGEPGDLSGYPDIVMARLPRRPIAFFCRKGHPLTKLPNVEMRHIAEFPLVGPRLVRRFAEHLPKSSALGSMSEDGQFFEPTILCAPWPAIREVVRHSDAITGRARGLLDMSENLADFTILPFTAPWFCSEHAILWRRDRMPHPALKAFCDAVRRHEAHAMKGRAMSGQKAMRAVA
jgi:DNA-binding transcriptional LysR family regulator